MSAREISEYLYDEVHINILLTTVKLL